MTRADKASLIERLHALWSTGDMSTIPLIYAPHFVAGRRWQRLAGRAAGQPDHDVTRPPVLGDRD